MNRAGLVLIGLAGVILFLGGALLASGLAAGQLAVSGAIPGFGVLVVILVAPLGIGGWVMLQRGRAQAAEDANSAELRKILDIVTTRGSVKVSDLVLELRSDMSTVQNEIYRLVGMGVFSGYVNWDDGVLYSAAAAGLRDLTECKKCGGKLTLAGKGVIKCPFCGTEYFVS
jgi:hypothetical protein